MCLQDNHVPCHQCSLAHVTKERIPVKGGELFGMFYLHGTGSCLELQEFHRVLWL